MRSDSELAAGWGSAGFAGSLTLPPGKTGFWRLVLTLGELSCPSRLDALEKVTDGSDKLGRRKENLAGPHPRNRYSDERDLGWHRGGW